MSRPLRRLLIAAALLLGLYAAGLGALYAGQRSMIFPAPDGSVAPPPGYGAVTLNTADGLQLKALYRAPAPGRPTLVFFHGNGDSLAGSLVAVERYVAAGYGALLPEYRGYGGNPGSPSEAGLYADGRAARAWLADRGVAGERQVLIGFSLGTGVVTRLAEEQAPAALILIAPYTSVPDVVAHRFGRLVPGWLVRDRLDSLSRIDRIAAPTLILHDRDDRSIPVAHGQRLAQRSGRARLVLFSGHDHQLGFAGEAQDAALDWLAGLGLR
ncbi:MAG: alpha/beta hydrolase [Sphingomonadales bacterium]|nr:alpha/beta hydrolase [Sphingomonadales bacterium]